MTAAALPDVFLAYQQRFMAAMAANPVVVAEKSRRIGYSWAMAAVAMLRAVAAKSAGGRDVLYMSYNQDITREFIDYVAEWARSISAAASEVQEYVFDDPDRPERQIKAFRVDFASGFKVLALPAVARAFRGHQGDVIIDEAAFIDDLDAVITSALALGIWGGHVAIVSTHFGDANAFNTLVSDVRAGRRPYVLERCTLDDAIADGLYRRICFTTGKTWSPEAEAAWRADLVARYGADADEELFCIPSQGGGAFLPLALIEARYEAAVPVLRWHCPAGFAQWSEHARALETGAWLAEHFSPVLPRLDPQAPHALGLDFARRGDLTVIWVLAIGADLVCRTAVVIELRDCPFEEQKRVLYRVADVLPKKRGVYLDATGNGMYLAEAATQKYGALALGVMMTEPWYRENMPPMKAAFEDGTISVPRDRELVDDLRGLKMVRGVARIPERTRNDEGLQRHGDGAIALALAIAASRAEPEAFGYEPAGERAGTGPARRDFMRARDEEEDREADGSRRALTHPRLGALV